MKINLTAPIGEATGYGEFSRHVAAGLISAGADLKIRPLTFDAKQVPGLAAEFGLNLGAHQKPDVCLICMIPPKFKEFRQTGAKMVGFSMFEAERLPEGWAAACNELDQVWVPSNHNWRSFAVSGVKTPVLMPPPIRFPALPEPRPANTPFSFYSCFQWGERKNPIGLIRAYWAEFSGRDDVVLKLKLYLKDQDQAELQRIQSEIALLKRQTRLRHYPRIEIIHQHMAEEEILGFHKSGDCYVSASRGEGLGLGAVVAMGLGKPCILSLTSGHLDFALTQGASSGVYGVPCSRAPSMSVGNYAPFYEGTNWWSEPDLGVLGGSMQAVMADQKRAAERGQLGAKCVRELYDFKTNSENMMAGLKKLLGG